MKLSDKIVGLRKSKFLSQEEFGEKLNVSRQAISRWEMGLAMPDAANILQISKLFGVTTDYLLNDDYTSDNDLPKIKEIKEDSSNHILIYLIAIEVMTLLMQFMTTFVLQNIFFAFLSFALFLAPVGRFEYAYRKKSGRNNQATAFFRKRFYKISAWLGLYFPVRFIFTILMTFYPRPYPALVFECVVLVLYLGASMLVTLSLEKNDFLGKSSL